MIACGSGEATTADSIPAATATTSSTTDPSTTTTRADTTDTTSTSADDTSDTTAAPIFDLGATPDVGGNACVPCELALMTTQSNALHTADGEPLVAEARLDGTLVFGMREADAGRVAFSGDGNALYRESSCRSGRTWGPRAQRRRGCSASAPTGRARA